jgi:dsDNA-specific endonuclease/ATPase MutS2
MPVEKAKKAASPLPKDSQRLINKVRREEMEEDARMRRMSSQMSAMLREAKQALGSKFEIEDEYDDDAGYNDAGLQQSGYFPRFS